MYPFSVESHFPLFCHYINYEFRAGENILNNFCLKDPDK